jgi:hypothetical protein
MSLCNPRCKAFCRWAEYVFWAACGFALFALWAFFIFKAVTT